MPPAARGPGQLQRRRRACLREKGKVVVSTPYPLPVAQAAQGQAAAGRTHSTGPHTGPWGFPPWHVSRQAPDMVGLADTNLQLWRDASLKSCSDLAEEELKPRTICASSLCWLPGARTPTSRATPETWHECETSKPLVLFPVVPAVHQGEFVNGNFKAKKYILLTVLQAPSLKSRAAKCGGGAHESKGEEARHR